ncbi:conserved hypothetical protein [Oleispira antarctica RB-8]|uniref:Uncharacterized protein n=1 Tax=Oleispira antarctica RB-8 TaxID=698738 RepID=R4YNJ9_OLEAN|nr:conserved hypothetical protein [Oleispira antarctica RB-8]
MVDTWQPSEQITSISAKKLLGLASLINGKNTIEDDIKHLESADIELISSYLNAPQSAWLKAIEEFTDTQILDLCMLFTVGEMKFPTWTFGSKNPTIYFLRHLKAENRAAEKDFVRWLKKQTDNRYIPYGPALI